MTFLRGAFSDLERFARAVQSLVDEPGLEDAAALRLRLRDMLAESDVEYVIARMPRAVDRVIDGLGRVSSIVRAMKDFSHLDQREKQPADLNDAIEKTLIITKGEYKHVADVVKDLGALPRVRCHVGDIQQVLVNLVINASHAIEARAAEQGRRGVIRVRSFVEPQAPGQTPSSYAVVTVEDNGGGIPQEVAARVFEPFFTTKEPGRGTGQGLPISREIVVERHGGRLEFDSVPGSGTTFYLRLPLA
jgi:signal transduction histidine kinase